MFLNGTYGTILYKPYDVVYLSNGTLGIITQVLPSTTVKNNYGVSYTYHAYRVSDYNKNETDYTQTEYTISPPDKNWKGNLNVFGIYLTDYSFNNKYLPYITSLIDNQDKWKFQFIAIHWIKVLKNLISHPADNILKQGKLLADSDILNYITEVGITPGDIYSNKFEEVFSKSRLVKSDTNVGVLRLNQYILITDKSTGKTVLAKTISGELAKKAPPKTSNLMDIVSFGLKALSISSNPLLVVITNIFGSSGGVEFAPPVYFILLDNTIGAIQYNWRHDRWEGNINVTILTDELGAYFDSNINDITNTFRITGKTDAIATGVNKLNSGVPLTPSEIAAIKQPIKDIISNQQAVIANLKTTGVQIPYGYEDKLSKGIPLTVDEENIVKDALTKRLGEVQALQQLKESIKVSIVSTSSTSLLTIPVVDTVQAPTTIPQQDLVVYYKQLPKNQQYVILAGAGLVLLFLVL